MYKYLIFLFLLFLIFFVGSCKESDGNHQTKSDPVAYPKDSINKISDILQDVRGENIFVFTIHPKLPDFKFVLIGDSDYNTINGIDVYKLDDSSLVQNIPIEDFIESPLKNEEYFFTADFNFDGFKDIALNRWWGSAGSGYTIWLYNSSIKKFKTNSFFDDIDNPTIDSVRKCITTISPYGGWGCEYVVKTYKYALRKFVLIKEKKSWVKYGKKGYDVMEDIKLLQSDTLKLVSRKRKETYKY